MSYLQGIHQPDYIPWLGLFYKMYLSDVFIHLDDAQFSNEAAHNFNTIKTPQGAYRLKFPVEYHLGDPINLARPKYELKWREKHLKTIEMNYAKSKYFKDNYPEFKDIIMLDYPTVADFNISVNEYIACMFGIKPKFIKYISGNGARVYQDSEHFSSRGVQLTYLDYKPISYRQLWGEFLPCLSVLDYIFNCGYDWEYVLKEVKKLNEGNR